MRPLVRSSQTHPLPPAGRSATRPQPHRPYLPAQLVPAPVGPRPSGHPAATQPATAPANPPANAIGIFGFDFAAAEADGSLLRVELGLARRIRAHLPRGTLSVTLTDNRHTMISV